MIACILVLLLAALGWLLGTASGAAAVLDAIASFSGGTVQAQGIDGRLISPLRLDRLTLEQPGNRVVLRDVRLDWRPTALLEGTLHLSSLHVGHIGIASKGESTSQTPGLPERIALPFSLKLDDVQVDGGEIRRGPVTLARLGPLAFRLDFDGNHYRLQLHRFAAGSAREGGKFATSFSGEASLAASKPYALHGRFSSTTSATLEQRTVASAGTLGLDGSLAEVNLSADLAVSQTRVNMQAILRPFSEHPLGRALGTAGALDLSAFDPALPQTAMDIKFNSDESGAGALSARNAAAGTYNDGKLPLHDLRLAFREDGGQFLFEHIVARLGTNKLPAGDITGHGRYADGALTLILHTDALDVRRVDGRVRATRLAGNVELRSAAGKQEFTAALNETSGKQGITLEAHATLAAQELRVDRAALQAGNGRLQVSGHVSLAERQSFSAKGVLSRFRLKELGNFPQLPDLDLNADFSLQGTRQPQLEADLAFHIADSRLAGQPLVGDGEAQLRGEQLRVPRFLLTSGANRLNIQGQLSQGDAQLAFALDAPQLAQLGPAFGGALKADGSVRGSLDQPQIRAEWNARNARLPGRVQIDSMQGKAQLTIDRKRAFILDNAVADMSARGLRVGDEQISALSAQLRFAPQPDAPLALDVRAEGITTGRLRAERFTAVANGSTARHTIDATLAETGQSWTLKAEGGLSQVTTAARWQGSLAAFDAAGRFNARLTSPAALLVSQQRTQLDHFLLAADSGRIAVDQFARDADGIVTRGRIEKLQLAQLLRYMSPAPPVRTDLILAGEWNLRIADRLSGTLAMRREGGDVTVVAATPIELGLRALSANLTAEGGRLALQLQADGRRLGIINVNAATVIGGGATRLSISPDAPVTGSARIDVPSIAWIAPLLSPTVIADGRLQSDITLSGNFDEPKLAGRITGEALRLALTDLGLDLRQGLLDSEFQGDRLLIRSLAFQGSEGSVSVSGPVDLGSRAMAADLRLQARRFALLNRADRRLVISGDSQLLWREQRGTFTGAFTVDAGYFDLGSADKPQLSDDVVIVGREKKQPATTATAVDITIALGENVILKGRGLDARLGGEVRIASKAGENLRAQGTLSVSKGTYSAYGRELAIEQGVLRFRGALNNPSLDILAMRRGQEVEAGVSVRGNVLAPRVTLVSEPTVPDAEKLSWLVLGRGLSAAGESDAGALQAAASALLSESAKAGVQSRIASAFGLDTFSVDSRQDNLQQRIVTLGKQVSSRLYVGYEQALESAGSVVRLRYTLSPKLSVEAEAGTRSAISLFYNIAFD